MFAHCAREDVIERCDFQAAWLFAAARVFVKPCAMPSPVLKKRHAPCLRD